jgi:hypothetical protein
MQPEQSGIKTWQWVVTVIVIIILIIIGIFVFGNKTETSSTNEPISSPTIEAGNGIVMSNQFPGNVVYISSVSQTADQGWIAIQKSNNGQPGAVIGYASVSAGTNPVKITLSQPTIDGGTYYAVMYTDDGDGKFDINKDQPLRDTDNNVIMHLFHASATANAEIKG